MLKSVQLKLFKIKYSGGSIGDDIRVEVGVLGKFLRVDKRIKVGATAIINQEIGRFETDRGLFSADVFISIIDKDIFFNDVGNTKGSIKVNIATAKSQQFVFEIQIRETRSVLGKFWGKKTANFEITLKAEILDVIKYVPDEGDGWLKCRIDKNKSIVELPAFLKVKLEKIERGREYFTILEGPYRFKTASVKLRDDGTSQFITGVKHEPMARAFYSISDKVFTLKGKKYKVADYPKSTWKKGLYDIEIPDYAHRGGRNYLDESKRAMTWFKIGHDSERYLHTGSQSLGCITITEVRRWMEIYNSLIKARKDSVSVGVLEVID